MNGQGYHFKLQLSQEPQKHKTFWVNCPRWGPADLSIAKRADPGMVGPDGQVLYTLTVDNHGPSDATGITVRDTPPAGVSLSSAEPSQGSYTITGGHLSCALGSLPAGGSAQVLVTVMTSAAARGNLTNKAAVTAAQPDPNHADNMASSTVTVPSAPPVPEQDGGPRDHRTRGPRKRGGRRSAHLHRGRAQPRPGHSTRRRSRDYVE